MPYQKGSPSDLKRKRARAEAKKSRLEGKLGPGVTKNPAPNAGLSGGTPEYVIDKEKLQALAATMASYDEMSLVLGVPEKFLRDHYKAVIDAGQAEAKTNLRSVQFATAKGGNVIMQIWLGKQYLGQKDIRREEQTGPDGKPIEHSHTRKVVAYIPENHRDG